VGGSLLARRKPGVQLPSPPPPTYHAAWSPPAVCRPAILARIQPLPVGLAHCQPPPTTTTYSKLAPHGLRQLGAPGSNLGQTTRRRGHGGRPHRPRPSQPCRCRPHRHAPRPHYRRTQRTPQRTDTGRRRPDTGHLDAQAPATDTGHLDRHPRDTGHRTPAENADTARTAEPASGPPCRHAERRTLRRPNPFLLRTSSQLLGRSAGQAAPWRIALLGKWSWGESRASDEASSVMARAEGWIGAKLEQARQVVQFGGLALRLMTRGTATEDGACARRRRFRTWPVGWRPAVGLRSGVVPKPPAL
jgi:hypothetical protein